MTKKELLCKYRELLVASGISCERVHSAAPDTYLRKSKEDLERLVRLAGEAATAASRIRARNEYFATEEGAARKRAIESRMAEIYEEESRMRERAAADTDREFHEKFPDIPYYHVVDVAAGYTSRIILQYVRDGEPIPSRSIEICHSDNAYTINPATIGAVELTRDFCDADYFIAIGKLFERRVSTITLANHAMERCEKELTLRKEYAALSDELRNPTNI